MYAALCTGKVSWRVDLIWGFPIEVRILFRFNWHRHSLVYAPRIGMSAAEAETKLRLINDLFL